MKRRSYAASEQGQMAVELAIVMPVVLLIMVIAIDGLVFAGECARFDQLAPQHVLAYATSPAKTSYEASARTAAIENALKQDFAKKGTSVSVQCTDAGVVLSNTSEYTCVLKFAPWPLNIAGAPTVLEHTCSLVVDPYTPGELL